VNNNAPVNTAPESRYFTVTENVFARFMGLPHL
jgi:hypothetical protein